MALRDAAVHAGRMLALLHARMPAHRYATMEAEDRTTASWPFSGDTLLHGDFSPTNVFVDGDGRYVTLDGSPNFITTTSPASSGRASGPGAGSSTPTQPRRERPPEAISGARSCSSSSRSGSGRS